jgi:iron-sulfur cluster assembly protein
MIPIEITPEAEREIKHIMANKNIPEDYFLRVGVKGGGCGGMSFALGFDKKKAEDEAYVLQDIPVVIEKKHLMFLMGLQLDFFEGDEARGFTFTNPSLPKRHDL